MTEKKARSAIETELEKAQKNFDAFDDSVKKMSLDRMNEAPKLENEQQTKLSSSELDKSVDIYIKPKRSLASKEKFNEKFRDTYTFAKEYVHFIAENKEIIGETINMWTKPFPGVPCEEWEIPTNKAIWAPRYVAEQIKGRSYHRFYMEDRITGNNGMGQEYGCMAVDKTIQRLDAHPVQKRRSIFMNGNSNF